MSRIKHVACMIAAALLLSYPAYAGIPANIPRITIPAPRGSLTVPDVNTQEEALNRNVGSVSFVDSENYKTRYAHTLRDVLEDTPGVFVQNRYGQEMRVSVRGSGMARGFHARGIEILQDGIPNTLADGSGDFYQIDPLSLRSVEVYKGGNGLAFGSTTLGGAVNVVTPTAYTAVAPNVLRMEGGSFGTVRGNAQVSRIVGAADFLVNGTVTNADGYRDHSRTQSESVNANIGYRFNQDVETRFYLGAFIVDQQLPGSVSLNDALRNPVGAAAPALAGDQARDSRTQRIANKTSLKIGTGKLDFSTWAIHKNLFHPIFQVLDQDGWTYGVNPHYANQFNVSGLRNELLVGARFFGGNTVALQYTNVGGSRGAQQLNARQDATNYEAYFENRLWFLDDVALMTGAKAFHSGRNYRDLGGLPGNLAPKQDSKDYDGINPKLGFLWQPQKDIQAFIDVTRSRDVPDFTDLTQTTSATTRFVPLKAQDGWTLEMGTRGKHGRLAWDATMFRSWISDELMQFTVNPSIPASTFNAKNTLHQGIELGVRVDVARDVMGGDVAFGQLWNYSDFRFQNDAQYGGNRIAGVPEHVLRSSLSYKHRSGFYATPAVDWVPDGAFADQKNTLKVPGYAVLGLQTGFQFENGVLFYIDARNLTNENYVTDISAITDASKASTSVFYPGEGRAVFAGLRYAF